MVWVIVGGVVGCLLLAFAYMRGQAAAFRDVERWAHLGLDVVTDAHARDVLFELLTKVQYRQRPW